MVEELYRSNAGIVGPKLVTWDNARVLQDVGLDVDRFGQPASRVERRRSRPGAARRGHRRVRRPVGLLPRARRPVPRPRRLRLGDELPRRGRRPVLAGAHQRGPGDRRAGRPGAPPRASSRRAGPTSTTTRLRARHHAAVDGHADGRLAAARCGCSSSSPSPSSRSSSACSPATPARRGRPCGPLVGAIPRFPTLLARRGAIAKLRQVSDAEVHDLQSHGSNRLASFRRARETQLVIGVDEQGGVDRGGGDRRHPALARALARPARSRGRP